MGKYQKGSLRGGSNINLNFIIPEDDIVIPSILQSYVLHRYHLYLLYPGMDRIEAMVHQHFYWPGIRKSVQKAVTNCNTFQNTKR